MKFKENYFDIGFKIFAFILPLIAGYITLALEPFVNIIIVPLSLLPLIVTYSSFYVNEIDLKNNRLSEYFVFAGVTGKKKSLQFTQLIRIYIKNTKTTQRIETRTGTRFYKTSISTAILVYDHDREFLLFATSKYKDCIEKINKYNQYLNLPLVK